jgi:LytS/YehU family sensor histidine kinase
MALKKTVTTEHGFAAVDAYLRVEGVRLVSKTQIEFQVRAYKETSLPHFSDEPNACSYSIEGPNPIAQAYVYMKTLQQYSDATDC